jgi:hypothetical protein
LALNFYGNIVIRLENLSHYSKMLLRHQSCLTSGLLTGFLTVRFSVLYSLPILLFSFFLSILQVLGSNLCSLSAVPEDRMPVNLTQGAIERMSTQDFSCDKGEFHPELQVIGLENSRIWLSDGSHYNVGLLFKSLDEMGCSDWLQIGSTVKLTHFGVCAAENYK